jgi:2-amino-4-hydroxy-6-hydroxymethyldihydropteridine diphosphokinase
MNKVYILLGSNIGNTRNQLKKAIAMIERKIGIIARLSAIYQTAAWGKTDQPDFLNQVLIVETRLNAHKLMEMILGIESSMGRIRTEKNAPRIIDIDILYFNKLVITEKHLTIPHPAIQLRRFVLTPLNELSPNFIHPVLKKTNHQLLLKCPDKLDVKKN